MDLIKNKSKAQISLEHILLIGGSILLAIIILAVVVNMGSRSRKNTTTQNENITYTTGGPMAPSILSVQAKYLDCTNLKSHASLTFSWDPIAVSGNYSLIISDFEHKPVGNLDYTIYSSDGNYLDSNHLNPFQTRNVLVTGIDIGDDDCGNSYYLSVAVKKGNQVQVSREYPFSWSEQGPKTVIIYKPSFVPPAGSYNIAQFPLSVKLELPEPAGNQIYYTTDGSTPTKYSIPYTYGSSLSVSKGETLKAITVQNGKTSAITQGTYIESYYTVDTPTANPVAQINLEAPVDVSLFTTTSGANIYYTLDSSIPNCTPTGTLFNGTPIHITDNTKIKAIACKTDYIASAVATFDYNYYVPLNPPTFTPAGNTYHSIQYVGISSSNPQAEIHYTSDGVTDPSTSSPIYSSPITVASNMTLKAKAFIGVHESTTATESYIIELPADDPVFSPSPGTYNDNIIITITTSTPQPYEIRYTLDGSDPQPSSALYTTPVILTKNTTLKAVVYKTGYTPSNIITGIYNFKLNPPSFSKSSGAYSDPIDVQINSVAGATIRYTTDGSTPTQTHGVIISNGGNVTISNTTTLKAIAYKTGWSSSVVASSIYTINAPAANPVFTPDGGTFTNSGLVSISCSTPSSTIRYTTDGSTPTRTVGTVYNSAISFINTTTINAVCYADGYSTSSVVSKAFTVNYKADVATFSKSTGTYNDNLAVYITTNTPQPYEIRYTTDGSTPTSTSPQYTLSPVLITKNTTLKAIVYKSGYTPSDVTTAVYTFKLDKPTFNPTNGNFADYVDVQINSVAGATIRYTTDGSTPTQTHGVIISNGGNVTISSTTTLKAIAYKTGWSSSVIASSIYTINAPAANPVFSPDGGTFTNGGVVSISCSTPSSTIRYTTDGSTPTRTVGTVYSSTISFINTTTINAVCYADAYSTSSVVSKTFTVNYPPGDVYVSGGGVYCTSATLTATGGSGGTIYYEGTTSNGTSISDPTTSKVVSSSGTYYFRARSSAGIWGNQGSAVVIKNNDSVAPSSILGNTSVCSGVSTTLTEVGGSLGTGASYKWYSGGCGSGASIGTGTSITVNPTSTTTYYVRAEGTCGNTNCASTTVSIVSPPTVTTTDGVSCNGNEVTLSATTTSGTIEWYDVPNPSPSQAPIAFGNTYTIPYLSSNKTYYVNVSGATCKLESGKPVTATLVWSPPSPTVTAAPYGECTGEKILTASGSSGGTIYYQGTNSTGTSTSDPTTSKIISTNGTNTYYFRAKSITGNCWSPSTGVTITIKTPPIIYNQTSFSNLDGWTVHGGYWYDGEGTAISSSGGCMTLSPWYAVNEFPTTGPFYFYRGEVDQDNIMIEATTTISSKYSGHNGLLFDVAWPNYYSIKLVTNYHFLSSYLTYKTSDLSSKNIYPQPTDGKYNIKVITMGNIKKSKIWEVGYSEPSNWSISISDSNRTNGQWGGYSAGKGGLCSIKVTDCS